MQIDTMKYTCFSPDSLLLFISERCGTMLTTTLQLTRLTIGLVYFGTSVCGFPSHVMSQVIHVVIVLRDNEDV
jgi:hypothetical protein